MFSPDPLEIINLLKNKLKPIYDYSIPSCHIFEKNLNSIYQFFGTPGNIHASHSEKQISQEFEGQRTNSGT